MIHRFKHRIPPLAVVFVGGALGGLARYALGLAWPDHTGRWPGSTLLVNVVGAFCLALLLVLLPVRRPSSRLTRPFLGSGVIGAFTTYSTLMVDTDTLRRAGEPRLAAAYVVATMVAGLLAATAGLAAGRALTGDRTDPGDVP